MIVDSAALEPTHLSIPLFNMTDYQHGLIDFEQLVEVGCFQDLLDRPIAIRQ